MPVVDVPQGATPKAVTFIVPYYLNPNFLQRQIAWWCQYPESVRAHVSAIIADDCSPVPAVLPSQRPFPIRLLRMEKDYRWGWPCARNRAAHEAPDTWLLLTDMDHVVPPSTAEALVFGKHDPERIYVFSRIETTGEKLAPHPNSFLMTRDMFWRVGGYDERFLGHYGNDGRYRRRCAKTTQILVLRDRLIRHEHVGDASTPEHVYARKQPLDANAKRIEAAIPKGAPPKTLTVPWHEVTA